MRVALYARVSTKMQEKHKTIVSQVESLRTHARQQEYTIAEEFVCLDEGVSGVTLARRGLDRLRDGAEAGQFDAVLVLSPDRLSRRYAYLILIQEEFQRFGVRLLETPPGDDPQTALLTQIQGAVAEYERAKLAERYRRGKLHRARQGEIFWTSIPFGYRHVPRRDGVPAHVEIDETQAAIVRSIFTWHGDEGLSVRQATKRLTRSAIPTPKGGNRWGTTTVHRILGREAYLGTLYYNRSEHLAAPVAPDGGGARAPKTTTRLRPRDEWISVSIPAIIDRETFERSQARHESNTRFSPRRLKEERWLLRRLLRCGGCGYKHGCVPDPREPDGTLCCYYRCGRQDGMSDRPRCRPNHVRADALDELVWDSIRKHLLDPESLVRAHGELKGARPTEAAFVADQLQAAERRLRQGQAERSRLLDAYQNGFVPKVEFDERARKLAERLIGLEADVKSLKDERRMALDSKQVLDRIEGFTRLVTTKLDTMSFHERQALARSVLDEVVLEGEQVRLHFKIPLPPPTGGPPGDKGAPRKRPVSSQFALRSTCDQEVGVRVVEHRAGPGMQHAEQAGSRSEVAWIGAQFDHRGGRSPQQNAVDDFLMSAGEAAQLLRQGEGQEVVGTRKEPSSLKVEPALGIVTLALGAVAAHGRNGRHTAGGGSGHTGRGGRRELRCGRLGCRAGPDAGKGAGLKRSFPGRRGRLRGGCPRPRARAAGRNQSPCIKRLIGSRVVWVTSWVRWV